MPPASALETSYSEYERYPRNLVQQPLYAGTTVAYEQRLNKEETRLLQKSDGNTNIKFREIDSKLNSDQEPRKRNVLSDQELKDWLGDKSIDTPNGPAGDYFSRGDPKCRFIFLWAQSSRSELFTTRKSLVRLLSYHQVMPEYINFISVFGRQEGPADPIFSNFCEQTMLSSSLKTLAEPRLERSGRNFQLSYNIKAPAFKKALPEKNSEWSIRQAAIHHQFDIEKGTALWFITRGGDDIYNKIKHLTDKFGRPEDRDYSTPEASFRASLSIHLLHALWALEQWKPYVHWLEMKVEERTGIAVYGTRAQGSIRYDYSIDELRRIQLVEDQITLAIRVLEANVRVLNALRKYYEDLLRNADFSLKAECEKHIRAFTHELDGFTRHMNIELDRASFLVKVTSDRKGLILQYLQSQENEKNENLAINMRQISLKSHRETIAMSIITVVTLIYLPATFTSTFFSTDVIKYQGTDSPAGEFSSTALYRWLQVTLPLTLLTLIFAGLWFRYRDKPKEKQELPLYTLEKN